MNSIVNIIYRIVTGNRSKKVILTPVCACFFLTIVLFIILLSRITDNLFRIPPLVPSPWNYIFALPIGLVGLFLWIWSVFQFLRAGGTPVPINPPPQLVQSGPYAYTRNPMLSGVFLMLFGVGLLLNSISLIFIYTPLFIIASILEFKLIEEPELEKRLGETYLAYKRKTPLLIPKLSAKRKIKP
ncbi:MAG: isoprenylcysteine carboxylmethyltransferase family protein [Syntrophales bacterium]|nr:isoprenylcysteine carboxylmethyltransferase family protein [Syntrophales bacterium]